MYRKDFLTRIIQAGVGLCWCSAVAGRATDANDGVPPFDKQESAGPDWINSLEERMRDGSLSPDWRRIEFAESWVKKLMENMDRILTEKEKKALMQACGRSCFIDAFGIASESPPAPDALDKFIQAYQQRGETEIRREGDTVYFQYGKAEQNNYGLRILDGYCMCPLVESGPEELSPTYCQCSAGYVKELFGRLTGKSVDVEVLESLRTGGSVCRFKITLPESWGQA